MVREWYLLGDFLLQRAVPWLVLFLALASGLEDLGASLHQVLPLVGHNDEMLDRQPFGPSRLAPRADICSLLPGTRDPLPHSRWLRLRENHLAHNPLQVPPHDHPAEWVSQLLRLVDVSLSCYSPPPPAARSCLHRSPHRLVFWKHRNAVIFDKIPPSSSTLLDAVKEEASSWASAGAKGLSPVIPVT